MDIVIVKGELMVLEINIGVMMDNLIDQGKENLAYEVSAEFTLTLANSVS